MSNWNFAEMWELCASVHPDAPALACGENRRTWAEFDRRADGIAKTLLDADLGHQDKFAQYLYNCNEYLESMYGAFKASLVPVNTNYRYGDEELLYLWDNADVAALVFHGSFTEMVEGLRDRLPKIRLYLHVDDGGAPCPEWAVPFEDAAGAAEELAERPVAGPWGRSADDIYMLYTGGTTGMPKGVMWRQDDLFAVINDGSPIKMPDGAGDEALRTAIESFSTLEVSGVPACPLMHGTGAFTSIAILDSGGSVVTMPDHRFRPEALLDTIEREKVRIVTIVGDAFARPILAALDREPERWDISSLLGIVSSGVMWSEDTKRGLLGHHANMLLVDMFSSSEAVGLGTSVSTASEAAHTATFKLGSNVKVIDEAGREIPNGSGRSGRLAIAGRVPMGYYKDDEKTALTFPVIDGVRYSVPGDYAEIDADGTVHLLGRGSAVINTAGEKVFPEEVEEALKTHPLVADAAAVGLSDLRFGQTVCAIVELEEGASVEPAELIEHVKETLAGYKAPRRIFFVDSVGRAPNGKVDYNALGTLARARAEADPPPPEPIAWG